MDLIKFLALNKHADDYCRISALHAMAYAVVEDVTPREDVLAFYGSLFVGDETKLDSDFWGLLANLVCDLYPEELMDTIKKAYEEGLISPGMIGYKEFESELRDGKEKCLEKVQIDLKRNSLDDIHASMSWWACFNEKPQSHAVPDAFKKNKQPTNFDQSKPQFKKKKNKATKKKRKQGKDSKRKNRR